MNPLECHLLVLQPKISWGKKKSSEGGQDLRFALHTTVVVKWYFHVSKLFDFWKCILGQFLTQSFDQLLINSFGNLTSFQPVVSSMQRSEYRQAIVNCDNYNITEVCQGSSVVGLGVSRACKHAYKCSTMNPNLKPTEKPKERLNLSGLPFCNAFSWFVLDTMTKMSINVYTLEFTRRIFNKKKVEPLRLYFLEQVSVCKCSSRDNLHSLGYLDQSIVCGCKDSGNY